MRLTERQRELAAANTGLAVHHARRLATKLPHLSDAFESAALFGLCRAAANWKPRGKTRFNTYATNRILGAILDAIRAEATVVRRPRDRPGKPPVPERTECQLDYSDQIEAAPPHGALTEADDEPDLAEELADVRAAIVGPGKLRVSLKQSKPRPRRRSDKRGPLTKRIKARTAP